MHILDNNSINSRTQRSKISFIFSPVKELSQNSYSPHLKPKRRLQNAPGLTRVSINLTLALYVLCSQIAKNLLKIAKFIPNLPKKRQLRTKIHHCCLDTQFVP